MVIHDEFGTSLAGEICPNPVQEDTQTEAQCRQKLEVYERPGSQAPKPLTCTLPLCNTAQPFPTTAMLTLSSAIYEDNQNNLSLGTARDLAMETRFSKALSAASTNALWATGTDLRSPCHH
jgi:hypothetical protein